MIVAWTKPGSALSFKPCRDPIESEQWSADCKENETHGCLHRVRVTRAERQRRQQSYQKGRANLFRICCIQSLYIWHGTKRSLFSLRSRECEMYISKIKKPPILSKVMEWGIPNTLASLKTLQVKSKEGRGVDRRRGNVLFADRTTHEVKTFPSRITFASSRRFLSTRLWRSASSSVWS